MSARTRRRWPALALALIATTALAVPAASAAPDPAPPRTTGSPGAPPGPLAGLALTSWNPRRYGSLDLTAGGTVTDDSQSFDVYTQIAELLKGRSHQNPLADLRISHVYAAGASQSGRFLGVYYNT